MDFTGLNGFTQIKLKKIRVNPFNPNSVAGSSVV